MKKTLPLFTAIIVFALILAGGGYWFGAKSNSNTKPSQNSAKPGASSSPPPGTPVETAKVELVSLPQAITAVGSLRSDEAVVLRPEVSGRIAEILFREGQPVAKGAPLVRFDSSVQRAELAQAKANLDLNKSKYGRALDLQKKGFISSQAREEAENNFRIAQATFELAAARLAKLELRAPFSGTVGLRSVSVGDYVKDGQEMVNLEGLDPLKVDFRVPELFLKEVKTGQSLQISLDAFPNQIYEGRVFAINPLIDQSGRAIVIRALVKNTDARLRPGMFARVRLLFNENQQALVIPEQALVPVGDEHFVFKVAEGRAQRLKVEIGQRREGKVEILKGLTASDVVVTAGQLKIRDGATVQTVDGVTPGSANAAAISKDGAGKAIDAPKPEKKS